MPEQCSADEERAAHRRFGVAFNNEVWDLLDDGLGPESPEDRRRHALYTAYASTRHWLDAGTAAHQARGEYMIAKVAVAIGDPALALDHARRCLALVEAHPEEMEDWDAPFAHEVMTRALALAGRREEAAEHWRRSIELADAVADPEDHEILQAERDRAPW